MQEFDCQRLLDFGCRLHQEGRESADERLLYAGATSCLMALQMQQSALVQAMETEPQEFPRNGKFTVVALAWVLATVTYLLTDAAFASTLLWVVIAAGFVWEINRQQAADRRKAIHSAEQKLRTMEMQWSEEEDRADEFWAQQKQGDPAVA